LAKTLEFTDTSAQTVKIGDTTTSFTMVLGEDSNPVDLTNATSIIAKLGNSTGYLKSQTIMPDNILDPLSGKVIIKFDSDFMNGLPAGYYLLEVWVAYGSGTAIYPSGELTGFTINNNIQSANGSTITTITFDDFVEAMNKAASTIAKGDKGDKGDTGTVDNAGLTTAPAFVELKKQVDNSAVGTNLYTDTKDFNNPSAWNNYVNWNKTGEKFNGLTAFATTVDWNGLNQTIQAKKGETYTFSSYARYESGSGQSCMAFASDGKTTTTADSTYFYLTETWQRVKGTFTMTADGPITPCIEKVADNAGAFIIAGPKLEKGTTPTDWCPNPTEILTKADYAKIKAAILSLGGHLS